MLGEADPKGSLQPVHGRPGFQGPPEREIGDPKPNGFERGLGRENLDLDARKEAICGWHAMLAELCARRGDA